MTERGAKKIRATFKRMETDREYRERLIKAGVEYWKISDMGGKRLDDYGDNLIPPYQRRLVDDCA